MARKRISEYLAKTLLFKTLELPYTGTQVTSHNPLPKNIDSEKKYIVKVDQGIKGRFKKGLIILNQSKEEIPLAIKQLTEKGYSQFLIEEMLEHESHEEKYISIERTREGYRILFSDKGGVDIEQNPDSIQEMVLPYSSIDTNPRSATLARTINADVLEKLLSAFDQYYFSFLEINPFILLDTNYLLLDAAVEVDSTAEFFVNGAWAEKDFIEKTGLVEEEENIKNLAKKSQAAFSLEVLNPNGSIFMLLSGGGASIVLADETANFGYGKQLANYGEYSGNPNAEETYIYAKNIINLLLKSSASKKVLIIAGGVANFTDVRITFKGLIKAIDEFKIELKNQNVKVYVRRGGPYQEEGLGLMKEFLQKEDLLGLVARPEMILTDIVSNALRGLA